MSSDKNNLDGTVSKTYVDNQADLGTSTTTEGSVSAFHFSPSEITHHYHPHHDAIRIRVLEAMVERLLEAIEKDPDSSSEIAKLRQDFQDWREELKNSAVVDKLYPRLAYVNHDSLPFRLDVKGLPLRVKEAE